MDQENLLCNLCGKKLIPRKSGESTSWDCPKHGSRILDTKVLGSRDAAH